MSEYLIHFNKNHSPKNGQFTFGDGDGDGQINDRANRGKSSNEWVKKNIYEYRNGTLTPAGSRRYQNEIRSNRQKPKDKRVDESALRDPNKWIRDDLKSMTDIARASKDASTSTSTLLDKIFKSKPNERLDLSKMSDSEIINKINREINEVRYNELFNKPRESKGKKFVKKALEVNSVAAETTIAGLTIATLIVGLYSKFHN